jgi:hypothetical protein
MHAPAMLATRSSLQPNFKDDPPGVATASNAQGQA